MSKLALLFAVLVMAIGASLVIGTAKASTAQANWNCAAKGKVVYVHFTTRAALRRWLALHPKMHLVAVRLLADCPEDAAGDSSCGAAEFAAAFESGYYSGGGGGGGGC